MSRRGTLIGALLALAVVGGLGWLAWYLTHQSAPAAAAGRQGAPSGPGAAGGSGAAGGADGSRRAPPTTVGVATAERADIPVILESLGTVTPAATATVRPQVSGVLQKVLYREGQTVKAGQVLAMIDPRQFEMALQQASGQVLRDQAQLENARVTLQRYRTLLEQDSIARQDVDTQAALVRQLEATVIGDRANEGTARLNLSYTRIIAPISGRVGLRVVDVGNLVGANDANGIAVITQVSPIDVEFTIPQDRIPEVQARVAQGARLPTEALDRTRTNVLATGTFSTLDNQVDTQTGTVRAKARFANANGALFPNQFVNVRVLLRTIEGAIVVPVTAVRHGSNGDYVYVLNEAARTVSMRPVVRGLATTDRVAVTKGLEAGEKVITEGADRLRDGARVSLPGDAPAAGAGGGRRQGGRGGDGARGGDRAEGAARGAGPGTDAPAGGNPVAPAARDGAPASGEAPRETGGAHGGPSDVPKAEGQRGGRGGRDRGADGGAGNRSGGSAEPK